MNVGLSAAARRLPASVARIEDLIRRDEEFGALCGDLAAAESALAAVDRLAPALRQERRAECESWIEGLTAEISSALIKANIVPMHRPPRV